MRWWPRFAQLFRAGECSFACVNAVVGCAAFAPKGDTSRRKQLKLCTCKRFQRCRDVVRNTRAVKRRVLHRLKWWLGVSCHPIPRALCEQMSHQVSIVLGDVLSVTNSHLARRMTYRHTLFARRASKTTTTRASYDYYTLSQARPRTAMALQMIGERPSTFSNRNSLLALAAFVAT